MYYHIDRVEDEQYGWAWVIWMGWRIWMRSGGYEWGIYWSACTHLIELVKLQYKQIIHLRKG